MADDSTRQNVNTTDIDPDNFGQSLHFENLGHLPLVAVAYQRYEEATFCLELTL